VLLDELTVRYYYTWDPDPEDTHQVFICWDWGVEPLSCGNVSGTFVETAGKDADYYVELGFATGATLEAGGSTGAVQIGLHKTTYSEYVLTNDWSFADVGTLTENSKITLYRNGTKVWGQEPLKQ
jgi:hypothetical protein